MEDFFFFRAAARVGAAASASYTLRGICDTCRKIRNQNASRLFNLCCENRQPLQPQPSRPVWCAENLRAPMVASANNFGALGLELPAPTTGLWESKPIPFSGGRFSQRRCKKREAFYSSSSGRCRKSRAGSVMPECGFHRPKPRKQSKEPPFRYKNSI